MELSRSGCHSAYVVDSSSEEDSDAAPGFGVAANPGQAVSTRHLPSRAAAVLSRVPVWVHSRNGEVRIKGSVGAQLQGGSGGR